MMRSPPAQNWTYSIFFLAFLYAILYLLQSIFLRNLLTGNHPIRLKKNPDLPLRFRYDGTFKILQVADLHYGNGAVTRCRDVSESEFKYCSDLNSTRFLKTMLEAEKPDFIVFTGDNIFGSSATDAAESLLRAFAPVMESGLPWAAILGNHDQESTMDRAELMVFLSLMDYSVSQPNPPADESSNHDEGGIKRDIDGFGNYNLKVYGAPGSHLANNSILNLFFLDSGDRETVEGIRTYGWIRESQLRWLHGFSHSQVSQDQKQGVDHSHEAMISATPPALVFFHIPIPEIWQARYQKFVGHFQEAVACSTVNSGVLKALVSMRVVKAVFIGHDHKNDFCGNLDGIWFCYGGGFGYHGYGKAGWPRRARVISLELGKGEKDWTGVQRIRTWKRLDDEKLSKIDEQVLWESQSST